MGLLNSDAVSNAYKHHQKLIKENSKKVIRRALSKIQRRCVRLASEGYIEADISDIIFDKSLLSEEAEEVLSALKSDGFIVKEINRRDRFDILWPVCVVDLKSMSEKV